MTTLITGGTGSFGHAYLKVAASDVVVLSRDEEKQRRMMREYPQVTFALGDVRDADSIRRVFRNHRPDRVFHAAALKQVPSCEFNAMEAVKTNILGTDNVCTVAAEFGAKVVVLSTDKAVEPVGVMGGTKFLAEAVARNHGANIVRYGNVVGSRGSIIPLWRAQMAEGRPITVTDPAMTRFLITLDEAVGLVHTAFDAPGDGSIFVRKSPAATVEQLARVFINMNWDRQRWGPDDRFVEIVGIRPGEKLHEHLTVPTENAEDCGDYIRIKPAPGYGGLTFSSQDAPRLTDDELAAVLAKAPTDDYA